MNIEEGVFNAFSEPTNINSPPINPPIKLVINSEENFLSFNKKFLSFSISYDIINPIIEINTEKDKEIAG